MAEEIKKVLTVDTGQSTQTVKGLKKEISDLKDALLNTEKGGSEWNKTVEQLIAKQEQLNDVTRISKQTTDAAKDSIVGMEREYKTLYDTYKLLSEEQRNSDFGKNMASSLASLHEKLNETKTSVGNFKDNIGNYTQSVMQAFQQMGVSVGALAGPMKIATAASNGLGASLKALIANPVGAIIMAIVLAFKALGAIVNKVKEAINSNEESQMRLKEAMSAFQPIIDAVKNAWDAFAQVIVSTVEWLSKAVNAIRETIAAITDFLGITDGAKERIQQQNQAYRDLAKAQNELIKKKREYQKLNAKDEAEVARLREEAEDTDDLTKKKELLNQAKAKQAEIDARNLELAEENLRILKEEASHTANDAAMNEKLAQAEAEVERQRAAAAKNSRAYTRQLNTIEKSLNKTTTSTNKTKDAIQKAREEAEKMDETIRQSHLTKIQKLEEERDKWIEIYKAAGKATKAVEDYYNQQIADEKSKDAKAKANAEGQSYTALMKSRVENDNSLQLIGADNTALIDMLYSSMVDMEKAVSELDKSNIGKKLQNSLIKFFKNVGKTAKDKAKEHLNYTAEDFLAWDGSYFNAFQQSISEMGEYLSNAMKGEQRDGETIEQTLVRLITDKQREITELVNTVVDKGLPISDEDQNRLQTLQTNLYGLTNTYESLGKVMQTNAEIAEYMSTANYKTNAFFGGEQSLDANGFERFEKMDTAVTKLGKSLKNSAKVWADYGQAVSTVLNAVAGAWEKNIQKRVEAGEITEEQAEAEFKSIKAMQYSLAVINMAAGIVQAFSDPSLVTWYAKAAAAAAVLATGTAQIITIANTEMGQSSGAMGGNSGIVYPQMTDTTPYSYTRQVQTEQEEDNLNQPIYVSVVDIENAQNQRQVRVTESTF